MSFRLVISGFAYAALLAAGMASAQSFPTKPLRVVTAEPGGGNDFSARLISQALTGTLHQQVIVENRGGASGAIAAQTVAKAPADGYTLLLYSNSLWIVPLMRQNAAFDPLRDFAPITLAASSPNILVVHPSLPVKSVKDLIALAKAHPGAMNYGAGSTGSTPHLAAELFKSMAGINVVRISYRGNEGAYNDLISGQVQLMFATTGGATPHVKSGRLRALAVTSAQPSQLLPGLPTVAAAGLPGYQSASTYGMFAPLKTPPAIVSQLNEEIVKVLNRADVKEKFFNTGVETIGSTPDELAARIKGETESLGKVIREAGIKAD